MKSSDAGSTFAGAHVAEAVPLAPLTTLRVGPVARRLITCTSTRQVVDVVRELDAESLGENIARYWCSPAAPIW